MKIRQGICIAMLALAPAVSASAACKIAQLAEWPVKHAYNRPLIEGKINGHPVVVLVDTGASSTFMWRWAAEQLGMSLGWVQGLRVFGVGGEARVAGTMIKELQLGAYTAKNVQLAALGDEKAPHDTALVLGDEFFSSFSTEFDIQHGVIRLLRPEGCKADQLAYWSTTYSLAELQPMRIENPKIHLDILLNGKHVGAMLDTGAPTSMLALGVAERAGFKPDADAATPASAVQGVAEKRVESWVATFDTVSIGDETVRNVRLRVSDMFGKATMTETGSRIAHPAGDLPEMLLGFDFLISHRVLVLPKEHAVVFTYNGGPLFQYVEPVAQAAAPAANAP